MTLAPSHIASAFAVSADTQAPYAVLPYIIDIEASGFGSGSYPIEIGVALPDGSTECYLIKPRKDWQHWDSQAEHVHGISRDMLLAHGMEAKEAAQRLNTLLRGQTLYSDGWSKDVSWLARLFDSVGNTPLFHIDTLLRILNEPQIANWERVKQRVANELGLRRHRASADALILQQTYLRSLRP